MRIQDSENSRVGNHQDLIVWQKSMDLVVEIYELTKKLPDEEKYVLTSQLRRCAVSIPSNIAEGQARSATGHYLNHISIARGSLAELETQLCLTNRLQYFDRHTLEPTMENCREVSRMLIGLRDSLKKRNMRI